jgi:DDE superfamily endonuclease
LMRNGAGVRLFFPPLQRVHIERIACTDPAAYGLHLARWDCRSLQEVVVEQALVGAIHYATVARILAQASLQPQRRRYWKTATIDERFIAQAAKILWRYERVEWLDARDEVVLCLDEKPHLQVLVRRCPPQPMRRGQIARREFEATRDGTVTFLAALNVYDGSMWGCCLKANDQVHFLRALTRLTRRYAWARRLNLILDNGSSHIAHATRAYWASHPRLRVFYTPPRARWLHQAELLLRAFSDKYLRRFDPQSRQHFIDHLHASWPEYNRRFAHPCTWSWSCRDLYAWAPKQASVICSKTSATVH